MQIFFLLCLNWGGKLEFYECEGVYDPAYLNLDQNDPEAWKIYANKVRDIMSKMLNLPKLDQGWREW